MFSDQLLQLSQEILVVGGAVCIVLLFFLLLYVITCVHKLSSLIGNVKNSYASLASMMTIPMVLLEKIFEDKDT